LLLLLLLLLLPLMLMLMLMPLLLLKEVLLGCREEILRWGPRGIWRNEIVGIGVVHGPVIDVVYKGRVVYLRRDRVGHRIKNSYARSRDIRITRRPLAAPRVLP
jgi:hypothetical protein